MMPSCGSLRCMRTTLNIDDTADDEDEFFGFRPLPSRGVLVTNELIDSLRDDEGV